MVADAGSDSSITTALGLVLRENQGDCMSLGMFTHYVRSVSGCPDGAELGAEVLGQLGLALNAGLLSAGDLIGNSHFPWSETSAESISWVEAAWPDGPQRLSFETLQNICLLVNTPAGDLAVRASR
jgi:hypothetical protein